MIKVSTPINSIALMIRVFLNEQDCLNDQGFPPNEQDLPLALLSALPAHNLGVMDSGVLLYIPSEIQAPRRLFELYPSFLFGLAISVAVSVALASLKQLAFTIAVIIAYKYVKQQQQTLVTLMNKNFISRGNSKTIKTNREG